MSRPNNRNTTHLRTVCINTAYYVIKVTEVFRKIGESFFLLIGRQEKLGEKWKRSKERKKAHFEKMKEYWTIVKTKRGK